MMKIAKKVRKVHIIFVLIIFVYSFLLVNIVQAVTAGSYEPGSNENPLVAKDYVDAGIDKVVSQINGLSPKVDQVTVQGNTLAVTVDGLTAAIGDLNKQIADLRIQTADLNKQTAGLKIQLAEAKKQQPGSSEALADIKVKAGQQLIGGENTEFILISGNAAVVSVGGSGLLNVSSGSFVPKGAAVVKNSLMLVIKSDGRGFKASTECRILIRGSYTVK